MKAILLTAALLAATPAVAGGPVLITEDTETAAPRERNKMTAIEKALIAAGVLLVLGAIADGGSDAAPCYQPEPETPCR
jgi:hypothetical protein